ncbi:hypothetical protein RVR_7914 [Actinacidiphila reveromycinica]|uniref:DUF4139 domain-containing protein n=1 Tax=Actinacidiphila reveromycinica TaxID=659352 RepID=A0A7U3UXW7_9ACTN|nr:DUF4139 domain-containing protein [Streptomyces sp. SN-593]BBB00778.1 hypothetical protein RVR_7914 [Streptomyces sp. SN-593]
MGNGEGVPTGAVDGAPQVAGSELTAVVVHAEGAVCTRRASVVLPALLPAPGAESGGVVDGGAVDDGAEGGRGPGEGGGGGGARDTGTLRVRIGGLPPTLSPGSLRGTVLSGPPGLRVADVRVDVTATLRRGEEIPGLRLDLEDAEDRLARLRDRRDRLAAEIAEVAGFRAEPPQQRRGDPPRWAPVESILALAGFVDARLAVLHGRLRSTEDALEQAEHDADVLGRRLEETSGAEPTDRVEPSVQAVVTLVREAPQDDAAAPGASSAAAPSAASERSERSETSERSTAPEPPADREVPGGEDADAAPAAAPPGNARVEARLELEYHVPGATWTPVYQLRLDSGSGAGTLVLRAGVAQRTGEDWTGVRLGLSTADLLRRADLPELRSLRIGRSQQEPSAPGWREPPPGLDELFTGYDTATAALAVPASGGAVVGGAVPWRPAASRAGGAPGSASFGPFDEDRVLAEPAGFGYGAPPDAAGSFPGPAPLPPPSAAPVAPLPAAAQPRLRNAPRRAAAPGSAPGTPPAPPVPTAELLDYAGLVLAGPEAPEGRGTLRAVGGEADAVVTEYRRRAAAVAHLARPAHAVDVRRSAGSFDYRFDTAAPVDVEADGRWHTVPVSEVPVRTEFEYVCVPARDTAVFGTVLVTNTSAQPLLAGPADVMVGGDFVRTAALPTLAPGQRQAVGLGVAESVQVARRAHMRESTAGLRGGTTVLDHTVEVEVANRLPYPALVEVRERIPTSTDKDVRIEEHRAEPGWTDPGAPLEGQEDAYVPGARVWRVTLEPGRTATLTGGYEIRLPVGKSVVGGNRRN